MQRASSAKMGCCFSSEKAAVDERSGLLAPEVPAPDMPGLVEKLQPRIRASIRAQSPLALARRTSENHAMPVAFLLF